MDELELSLVHRARRGEEAAATQLYRRYRRAVFGYLLRQLRDRETAEDVFQEAWIKVFTTLDRFDEKRGSFRAWVFRIAGNAAIDRHRRERVRRERLPQGDDDRAVPDELASTEPGPDRIQAGREGAAVLDAALAALPERQQLAVLLRHQQGLTYAEIARAMQLPEGTAKTLVHRGMLALRAGCAPERSSS